MTKMLMIGALTAGLAAGHLRAQRIEQLFDTRVEMFLDEVSARPDQRERVKQLQAELKTDLVPLAKQTQANRQELATQWKADQVDRVKVHALVDRQADQAKVYLHRVADALIQLHDLLTPEQRAKAAERRAALE